MLKGLTLLRPLFVRQPYRLIFRYTCPKSVKSKLLLPKFPTWTPLSTRLLMDENEISSSIEEALKSEDKIPNDYRIIYRAPLLNYIKITYTTAVAAISAVPAVLLTAVLTGGITEFPVQFHGIPLFDTMNEVYILSGLLLITVCNVIYVVAKYPFRIYCNHAEKKYIVVYQHFIPLLRKKMEFKAGDVKEISAWLWKGSHFQMKNKRVILITELFGKPIYLEEMMTDPNKKNPREIQKRRSRML